MVIEIKPDKVWILYIHVITWAFVSIKRYYNEPGSKEFFQYAMQIW